MQAAPAAGYGVRTTVKGFNIRHHLPHALCALAAVAVIAAVVLGAPVVAVVGGLFCAAMMIGMLWMMVAMVVGRRR